MIQPIHNYVLLQEIYIEKSTNSGILLTSVKEKSEFAKVIAMGNEIQNSLYQVGDLVLFDEYNIKRLNFDNSEYLLVKDSDIIAVKKD